MLSLYKPYRNKTPLSLGLYTGTLIYSSNFRKQVPFLFKYVPCYKNSKMKLLHTVSSMHVYSVRKVSGKCLT